MKRKFLSLIAGFAVVTFASLFLHVGSALAASTPYDPSNLIGDSVFDNSGTMSASAIQSFLSSHGSYLANYSDTETCASGSHLSFYQQYYHCGSSESAAQIIYDAAQAYQVNPQVILATMQKEQSLVTNPNPLQSNINCAMGYNSCGGYSGFFTQIDNGTWDLERLYQRATGNNTYWNTNAYPCANASGLYNNGLYPGNVVTFANPGGTSETITIANAATAALYCYTPYVGPYSVTGYSGSYNFVISFETWFGSTTGFEYAWSYVSTTFSTGSAAVRGNTQTTVTLTALNTGNESWSNTNYPVRLGTFSPTNHASALYDSSWYGPTRPATLTQSVVLPGDTGTFVFTINVPNVNEYYLEGFDLVAEGATWMPDIDFTLGLSITKTNYDWQMVSQSSTNGFDLAPGQSSQFTLVARNTGNVTWTNTGAPVRLATFMPTNRDSVFYDPSWVSASTPATLQESSVAPGQTGTFVFNVRAPTKPGFYVERFNLVMENVSWFVDPWMEFDVNVT